MCFTTKLNNLVPYPIQGYGTSTHPQNQKKAVGLYPSKGKNNQAGLSPLRISIPPPDQGV